MSTEQTQQPERDPFAPEGLRIQVMEAKDLKGKTNNTREHDKRNLEVIEESVDEAGFWRSVAIDENNVVEAGNGTLQIAQKRGARIIVVDVDDPNTLVAVRRSGLDAVQKHRYNLRDNRATDLSKNNKKAINRLAKEVPAQLLLGGIFTEREQQKLLVHQANELTLGAGGTDDGGAGKPSPEAGAPQASVSKAVRAESGVRMVQLFLDVASQPEFIRKVRALSKLEALYDGKGQPQTTVTDIVVAVVNRAFQEWVPQGTAAPAPELPSTASDTPELTSAPEEATAEAPEASETGTSAVVGEDGPELYVTDEMREDAGYPAADDPDARFAAATAEEEPGLVTEDEETPGQRLAREVHGPGIVKG
jgi:hypothetical protein